MFLSLRDCDYSIGVRPLFEGLNCAVDDGERLAIVGPNGSGKSTLLRIMAGQLQPDAGRRSIGKDTQLRLVQQSEASDDQRSCAAFMAAQLPELPDYEVSSITSRYLRDAGFVDLEQCVADLSGGWRKRLAIASALAAQPDGILLDEPTNHLDLAGRLWLEEAIKKYRGTIVMVSHDRWFLDAIASRVLEINNRFPGGFYSAPGGWSDFLTAKDQYVQSLQEREASLANKHKREQAWLAKQPKARTTKNVARIKQAENLAENLGQVASLNRSERNVQFDFNASGRQSQDLIVCEGLNVQRDETVLIRELECTLGPGMCLGLLGGNGSGKSSFISVLIEELAVQRGTMKKASGLKIVTFDQTRAALDATQTLGTALCPNGHNVQVGGRSFHKNAWAAKFLFSSTRFDQPVESLSGGEQARLLISQLMRQEADVLILDEPTNDLDIPALEMLEQAISEFPGGIVLVTHDRWMLDRLATHLLAFNGDETWARVGSYGQWENQRRHSFLPQADKPATPTNTPAAVKNKASGLTHAEQKELRNLKKRIETAEASYETITAELDDPAINTDPEKLTEVSERAAAAQEKVEALYARWEELEEKA